MNIQIFGTKKCNDTKKAQRFFKERGINFQFIDMNEKILSKGELRSVCQAVGGISQMFGKNGVSMRQRTTMKKIALFLLGMVSFMMIGCGVSSQEASYRQINMDEAMTMMEEESGYIILDVRTPEEFAEKHIPDAMNIPNESIGTEEIPQLPDKDQLIMVYCRSGNRSKQASEKLVALGYTNIVEFGGINDWPGEPVSE